ncbi:CoA transferase [Halieaceae bacterium IMCC14734]|uniref:CoA transferase n=1 Tax=Candidatus Litorirhabdus singularis TaxID=2518993 RepID=A0ABT3TI39_9GAMM|nr:CoA transferase [Candidatus Litorirhabdus singularis]MCX2981988.1 CoA transferase [Candidatus Litorirhabdus singularis]
MKSILEGVRVLDLAQVLAGPFGAAMLGDLGADVVKIEPLRGDESRHLGPATGKDSAMFIGVNRNKRGMAIDLTSSAGQEVLQRLVSGADIIVDNMRPSAKARLGIDYATLEAINPRIIAVNVSAFGTSGPYAGRPGIDPLAQALGGIMSITGHPGAAPLKTGSPIVDATTAHLVVIAALAALRRRDHTGHGELIEVNLLDALFNLQPTIMSQYMVADYVQPPTGCGSELMAPYGLFQSLEGDYWQITALTQKFFGNLCKALTAEHLLDNPDYATNELRMQNRAILEQELAALVSRFESTDLAQRFANNDVMAAPVNSIPAATRDPQLLHNGMITHTEHAALGTIKTATLPLHFSAENQPGAPSAAPVLGQHNTEVLVELGYSQEAISELLVQGVLHSEG